MDLTTQIPPADIRPGILRLDDSRICEVAHYGMKLGGVVPLWFGEPDEPTAPPGAPTPEVTR